jgi:dihydrofolate reductase
MTKKIIAAITRDFIIGINNDLPWRCREDLRRFKDLTSGGIVIMGRNTFESMDSKPLPKRINIVITSQKLDKQENLYTFKTIHDGLNYAEKLSNNIVPIFFIGGARIFEEAVAYVDEVDLTVIFDDAIIDKPTEKDKVVKFPILAFSDWDMDTSRHPYHDKLKIMKFRRKNVRKK